MSDVARRLDGFDVVGGARASDAEDASDGGDWWRAKPL